MASFSLITPLDQPLGKRRLLCDLKDSLSNQEFRYFSLIVAYMKSGPLLRLEDHLSAWRKRGNSLDAIIGIDQQGTSREALVIALSLFDSVYVTQEYGITFHPKIYLFSGDTRADAFIGSNNLTVGGTEKNFESAVHIRLSLPADAPSLDALNRAWHELMPATCPATKLLTPALLAELEESRVVMDEATLRSRRGSSDATRLGRVGVRSGLAVRPESPLPRVKAVEPVKEASAAKPTPSSAAQPRVVRGLAIQVKPHRNGEIFLSLTAVLQNPAFFGWPFTGETKPKKAGKNPSYPQRTPDPVANIRVYGGAPAPTLDLKKRSLNTVYYETKSEIRITATPLVSKVPEYSIMIIEPSNEPDITWEITVLTPDSPDYVPWRDVCNQSMPGGGAQPRRFGWF